MEQFSEKRAVLDNKIMKLLDLKEIRHVVALTDRGELTLMLRKGENHTNYQYVLDSVPLTEDKNDQLKELLKIQ